MDSSHMTCPSCNHEIMPSDVPDARGHCPDCGASLATETTKNGRVKMLDPKLLTKFEGIDSKLAERLGNIEPDASWHLAVIAELLDYEYHQLSNSLNQSQPVNNRIFNLSRTKARTDVIKKQFHEYCECIADIQESIIKYIESDCKFPRSVDFWSFYTAIRQSFERLAYFHRSVIALKFVRDSLENELQGMMIDWVHYVLICLEGLKKQLDGKSKLELPQLKVRSVEVALAAPDMHLFFEKLEKLNATGKAIQTGDE